MRTTLRRRPRALLALPLLLAPSAARAESEDFFERRIRPLLVANCFECHCESAGTTKGGLALDSREGWQKGGESGTAIVPGDSEHSLLLEAVRYSREDVRMPPRGRLAESEIADIAAWIGMGAPDPRERGAANSGSTPAAGAAEGHWAYRPIADPTPPDVSNPAWTRDPVDRFVLAMLDANGLSPAPEADRRTWLRRVTFDLIGLPPSPADVAAFAADSAPDAFERVVDRLLASPQYGERWARLWLDVARYSDSNGSDENLALGPAWRYRDYVVSSLNADKPFDRFVTEQLAGDLLPEPDGDSPEARAQLRDQLVATGFLVLGSKMVAEPDKDKLLFDTIDEQIDVVSKAFLGQTLSCARCHDHKFDPFTQKDYYALAGIFRSTSAFDAPTTISQFREREIGTRAEIAVRDAWRTERAAADKAVATALEKAKNVRRAALLRELERCVATVRAAAADAVLVEAEDYASSTLHVDRDTYGNKEVGLAMTNRGGAQFAEYEVALPRRGRFAIELRYASGDARPLRVLVDGNVVAESAAAEPTGGFKVEHRKWATAGAFDAASAPGEENRPGPRVRIRLDRKEGGPQHFPHLDSLLVRPAVAEGRAWPAATLAPDDAIDSAFARECTEWLARAPARVPGEPAVPAVPEPIAVRLAASARAGEIATALEALADPVAALQDAALEAARKVLVGFVGPIPPALVADEARIVVTAEAQAELAKLRADLAAIDARKPPELDRALAVADVEVAELPVFVRGNHREREKDALPRATPAVLDPLLRLEAIPAGTSGRLQLARWIGSDANPLTARVIANRVWQGHFGTGIVATASNYGVRGEPPSHPSLLDHLARSLMREKWSLKALHRRIVLSATYRMSGRAAPPSRERDPDARLLSRFPRRRLDAEQIRDATLFVAGTLDATQGGSLLATPDREYVPADASRDKAQYGVTRRTLYLPVIRNAVYEFLTTFDATDATTSVERRTQSLVASQALWHLNSPFAIEQSAALAKRVASIGADDPSRVTCAYSLALQRSPSPPEVERAARYLAEARSSLDDAPGRDVRALEGFCQSLLAGSEFVYLD